MQIGGITASYPFRTTTAAPGGTATAIPETDDRSTLARSLNALREATAGEADDRKARAREKLDAAKKELDYLRRWGFDPDVVARQAGRLAREVGAAAKEFASALTAGTGSGALGGNAATVASPDAGQASADTGDANVAEADTGKEEVSFAEKAYRDTMDGAQERKAVSTADRKTLDEFKALAQEIKALLEDAIRRMREEKKSNQTTIDETQRAGINLDLAMQGLPSDGGALPGSMSFRTVTIPVSITI